MTGAALAAAAACTVGPGWPPQPPGRPETADGGDSVGFSVSQRRRDIVSGGRPPRARAQRGPSLLPQETPVPAFRTHPSRSGRTPARPSRRASPLRAGCPRIAHPHGDNDHARHTATPLLTQRTGGAQTARRKTGARWSRRPATRIGRNSDGDAGCDTLRSTRTARAPPALPQVRLVQHLHQVPAVCVRQVQERVPGLLVSGEGAPVARPA